MLAHVLQPGLACDGGPLWHLLGGDIIAVALFEPHRQLGQHGSRILLSLSAPPTLLEYAGMGDTEGEGTGRGDNGLPAPPTALATTCPCVPEGERGWLFKRWMDGWMDGTTSHLDASRNTGWMRTATRPPTSHHVSKSKPWLQLHLNRLESALTWALPNEPRPPPTPVEPHRAAARLVWNVSSVHLEPASPRVCRRH